MNWHGIKSMFSYKFALKFCIEIKKNGGTVRRQYVKVVEWINEIT